MQQKNWRCRNSEIHSERSKPNNTLYTYDLWRVWTQPHDITMERSFFTDSSSSNVQVHEVSQLPFQSSLHFQTLQCTLFHTKCSANTLHHLHWLNLSVFGAVLCVCECCRLDDVIELDVCLVQVFSNVWGYGAHEEIDHNLRSPTINF